MKNYLKKRENQNIEFCALDLEFGQHFTPLNKCLYPGETKELGKM